MTFNKHIQAILESLNSIPAFDGRREVYGYCNATAGDKLFYRFDEQDLEFWDKWKNVYIVEGEPMDNFGTEFTDRDEFFKVIEDVAEKYSKKFSDMHDIPLAVEEMKAKLPSDILCVYRYFGNHDHGDFWWGAEIDTAAIRTIEINKELEGADTTGFEDLL